MKILVTGFKPFNKENINPSLEIIKRLDNKLLDHDIYTLELNVEYFNDAKRVLDKAKEVNPDIILLLGQAGGRKCVSTEYDAINIRSATIKDNLGVYIEHSKIDPNGEDFYKSTIDLFKLKEDMKGFDFDISYHAGTFICNEIYYQTLSYIYKNKLNVKCAFIHFPFLDSQIEGKSYKYPSMNIEKMEDIFINIVKNITK